jgi:hypothetical protein
MYLVSTKITDKKQVSDVKDHSFSYFFLREKPLVTIALKTALLKLSCVERASLVGLGWQGGSSICVWSIIILWIRTICFLDWEIFRI